MARNRHYEEDNDAFPCDAYTVAGYRGIAFSVLGWETKPDQDTEWSGDENRTGNVAVRMIGDDRVRSIDPEDVTPLDEKDYCSECGQIGCTHDGREH